MFDPPEARHDYHSKTPGPCVVPVRGFLTATFARAPTAGRRRHPHHRPTHGRQPIAYRRRPDRRRPLVLPSRALPGPSGPACTWPPSSIRFLLRPSGPQGRIRLVGDDTVTENTPAARCTARHATATPSAPVTATPPGGFRGTSGWCWPSLCRSPSAPDLGRCRSWSPCTPLRPKMTGNAAGAHRTPAQLLQLLLRDPAAVGCPDRQFVVAGDAGYGSHEVASLARRDIRGGWPS